MSFKKAKKGQKTRALRRKSDRWKVTITLLDLAKEKTGSDRKTSIEIGLTGQKVSDVRSGRRQLPPAATVKLARLAGQDPFSSITLALAATARSNKTREFWLDCNAGVWPLRKEIYERWERSPNIVKYPSRG